MRYLQKALCYIFGHRWALGPSFDYKVISIEQGRKAHWHCCRCDHHAATYFPHIYSWDPKWLTNMKNDFAHYHLMRKMFRKQIMYKISKRRSTKSGKRVNINSGEGSHSA
jgi:hypothetical protein